MIFPITDLLNDQDSLAWWRNTFTPKAEMPSDYNL
jgi:hypothetical protein